MKWGPAYGLMCAFSVLGAAAFLQCRPPEPNAGDTTGCKGPFKVLHAYSECQDDGFWHVVTDGISVCPPAGIGRSRIHDIKTAQACRGNGAVELDAAARAALTSQALRPLVGDETCRSPIKELDVVLLACVAGQWEYQKRARYKCLDGSFRHDAPTSYQPTQVPCPGQAPPEPDFTRL